MKCPSCGAKSLKFMGGENRVCLSCGYGSSFIMELVAEMEPPAEKASSPGSHAIQPNRLHLSSNRFGFKLLSELHRNTPGRNILISPVGLFTSLSLLARGASGETAHSILRALELEEDDLNEAASQSPAVVERVSEYAGARSDSQDLQLSLSSALWARKGLTFQDEFLALRAGSIPAEVIETSFMDNDAGLRMSTWLREHAQGRAALDPGTVDRMSMLYLTQAASFHGVWQTPFHTENTHTALFTLTDGLQKKSHLMKASGWFPYNQDDDFQLAGIPYAGGSLALYVLVPSAGNSLETLLKILIGKRWESWVSGGRVTRGEIGLPRFILEYASSLNDALTQLGMGVIFDELRANFERMCPIPPMPDVYISQAWTQSSLVVGEDTDVNDTSGTPLSVLLDAVHSPFALHASQPFFFALREEKTGLLLLMGLVLDPK